MGLDWNSKPPDKKGYPQNIFLLLYENMLLYSSKAPWRNKKIQSTLVISNSKGLTETLRDIRTSTYQSWESEENNKLNNHIQQMNM